MGDFIKVTPMWKNTAKDGKEYFMAFWGLLKVYVFELKEPDEKGRTHMLYFSPNERKEGQ